MRLVLRFDGKDVQEFVLDKADITIGRTPKNDIVVDNLAVSGHHASVINSIKGAELVDTKSTNGVFVNDKKISRHLLQNGDVITIGKHQLLFFNDVAFSATGADEQDEATVMMSPDFHKQLQKELLKNKQTKQQANQVKKKGLWASLKSMFGLS